MIPLRRLSLVCTSSMGRDESCLSNESNSLSYASFSIIESYLTSHVVPQAKLSLPQFIFKRLVNRTPYFLTHTYSIGYVDVRCVQLPAFTMLLMMSKI